MPCLRLALLCSHCLLSTANSKFFLCSVHRFRGRWTVVQKSKYYKTATSSTCRNFNVLHSLFLKKSRCKLLVYCLNEKGHKDRTKEFIFSEVISTSKLQTIWWWWKKPDTLISLAARRQNWHKLQQSLNFLEQLPHFWTRYLSNTNPSHVGFGPSTGRIFHPISIRKHLVRKWCSLSDIPPNCIFLHCLLKRVRKVLGVSTDCCIL